MAISVAASAFAGVLQGVFLDLTLDGAFKGSIRKALLFMTLKLLLYAASAYLMLTVGKNFLTEIAISFGISFFITAAVCVLLKRKKI